MRTIVPYSSLKANSWAYDFTPSLEIRQKYMYVQCMGHYIATPNYRVIRRSNIHSYLLLYTRSGTGIVEYKEKKIVLDKESAILIDCDLIHSYYCAPQSGEWDFYWIHFSGTCINGYLQEIINSLTPVNIDLSNAFHQIYNYSREYNNINIIRASTAIINMCSDILALVKSSQLNSDNKISPIIKRSIEFMEERLTAKLTLDDISKEFGISKFYFSHLFKSQTGMTPYEYLINIRISYAKSLLRTTSFSVTEISENSGFNGCSYFIQQFKKQVGMTPLAYRNRFTNDSSN